MKIETTLQWLGTLPPIAEWLIKVTLVLSSLWLAHAALRGLHPAWRIALWRSGWGGMAVLTVLLLIAPRFEVALPAKGEATVERLAAPTPAIRARLSTGPSVVAATPIVIPPKQRVDWRLWLGVVWAGSSLLFALRWLKNYAQLRSLREGATGVPENLCALARQVAADLGYWRAENMEIRASDRVASPCVASIRRPLVLLPVRFDADLPGILAHEITHLRSRDLLWIWIIDWLRILLWFHPLVWRTRQAHLLACEEASDAAAATYVGDHVVYGQTLARLALAARQSRQPSCALSMAGRADILSRLYRLRAKPGRLRVSRRAIAISGLFAAVMVSGLGGARFIAGSLGQETAPRLEPVIIFADHVILWEGREVISQEQLEERLGQCAQLGKPKPHFYFTHRASAEKRYDELHDQVFQWNTRYHFNGFSMGSTSWEASKRYDSIQSKEDLIPDPSLRIQASVQGPDGKPATNAEVILCFVTEKDHDYQLYLRAGAPKLRHHFDDLVSMTGQDGRFAHYPPRETDWVLVVLHESGFAAVSGGAFQPDQAIRLQPWCDVQVRFNAKPSENYKQAVSLVSCPILSPSGKPEVTLYYYDETPDAAGDFHYRWVAPGKVTVSRSVELGKDSGGGSLSLPVETVAMDPGTQRTFGVGSITGNEVATVEQHRRQNELWIQMQPGKVPPDFTLQTQSGETVTLSALRGKWVLLDFWATWCPPCLEEIPHLKAVQTAHGARADFVMLGVSLDQEVETLNAFCQTSGITWNQCLLNEETKKKLEAYYVFGIPSIVLIGPDGKIAATNLRGAKIPETVTAKLSQ